MDDLAIAFAERCDREGLTYEHGVAKAEELADEIVQVAEDRTYVLREEPDETEHL
jgi:hypothetical protein